MEKLYCHKVPDNSRTLSYKTRFSVGGWYFCVIFPTISESSATYFGIKESGDELSSFIFVDIIENMDHHFWTISEYRDNVINGLLSNLDI